MNASETEPSPAIDEGVASVRALGETVNNRCPLIIQELRGSPDAPVAGSILAEVVGWIDIYRALYVKLQGNSRAILFEACAFLLDTAIPRVTLEVLRKQSKGGACQEVDGYLRRVIELVTLTFLEDRMNLLDTLYRIANEGNYPSPENDVYVAELSDTGQVSTLAEDYPFVVAAEWSSHRFLGAVNHFVAMGGLEQMTNRLRMENGPSPFVLRMHLRFLNRVGEYLQPTLILDCCKQYQRFVLLLVDGIREPDLKKENREAVLEVLQQLGGLMEVCRIPNNAKILSSAALDFHWKCFVSSRLEIRVSGLNEIRDMLLAANKRISTPGASHSGFSRYGQSSTDAREDAQALVAWLKERRIMDVLFGPTMHEELIRRCSYIPNFLLAHRALDLHSIELMWKASIGKFEAKRHIVYQTFQELAPFFAENQIELLFRKLREVHQDEFDEQTVQVLRDLAGAAANVGYYATDSSSGSGRRPNAGILLLWRCAMGLDGSSSANLSGLALQYLQELVHQSCCASYRPSLIGDCVENLKKHRAVLPTVQLLGAIIESYPCATSTKKVSGLELKGQVVEKLESQHHLIDVVLRDLEIFRETMSASAEQPSRKTWVEEYANGVQIRINFLQQVFARTSVLFSRKHLDVLWDSMMINPHPLLPQERDCMIGFLEAVRQHGNMSDADTHYVFDSKIPTLSFADLSTRAFNLFEYFLRFVNWKDNRFEQRNTQDFYVKHLELIGIDQLWRVALEVRDPSVGRSAVLFLYRVYVSLHPSLANSQGQKFVEFVDRCMSRMRESAGALRGLGSDESMVEEDVSRNKLVLDRCLTLLTTLVEEAEIKVGLSSRAPGCGHVRHGIAARGRSFDLTASVFGPPGATHILSVHSNELLRSVKSRICDLVMADERPQERDTRRLHVIFQGQGLTEDWKTLEELRIGPRKTVFVSQNLQYQEPERGASDRGAGVTPGAAMDISGGKLEILPSSLLGSDENFELLWPFLDGEKDLVAAKAWDLFMLLPTNVRMLKAFKLLKEVGDLHWERLLSENSIYKLLYVLQIVELLAASTEDNGDCGASWRTLFVAVGGLRRLGAILESRLVEIVLRTSPDRQVLALLLKLANLFLLKGGSVAGAVDERNQEDVEVGSRPSVDKSFLQEVDLCGPGLVMLLVKAIEAAACGRKSEMEYVLPDVSSSCSSSSSVSNDDEADSLGFRRTGVPGSSIREISQRLSIVSEASALLIALVLHAEENLEVFLSFDKLEEWLRGVLLDAQNEDVREHVGAALLDIVANSQRAASCLREFLLRFLDNVSGVPHRCKQYFRLLNRVVRMVVRRNVTRAESSDVDPKWALPVGLLERVVTLLESHQVVEERRSLLGQEDHAVRGFLGLIRVLLCAQPALKEAQAGRPPVVIIRLIREVYDKCLFETVRLDRRSLFSLPKCKSEDSRLAAFDVLLELVRGNRENFARILSLLSLQHQPGLLYRTSWHYTPRTLEKSSTGYTGMRNLGATCYMNSLMQQLHLVPEFRRRLLSAFPLSDLEKARDVLVQTQRIHGHLLDSELRFYDPRSFAKVFKDFDGNPMNVAMHMDAQEFLTRYFDLLESDLKGTNEADLLKQFFGAELVNQIVCSGNPAHVTEQEERMMCISLAIKNKKTLQECLELYVKGEVMEAENRVFCTTCNQKVDAIKRACIKRLPHTLIIHLLRFDWDVDEIRRSKLNDPCQFPFVLDMEPYSRQGLAKAEGRTGAAEESTPSADWIYVLKGVLVHTGTAHSGHYYSYVQEREPNFDTLMHSGGDGELRWLHFNDVNVDFFEPSEIPRNCYGGYETVQQYDATTKKTVPRSHLRPYNAYMLFYERKNPRPVEAGMKLSMDEKEIQQAGLTNGIPAKIHTEVWNDNMAFLRDKNIFDRNYFDFLAAFVRAIVNPSPEFALPASLRLETVQLASLFFVETLAHAKEKGSQDQWTQLLKELYSDDLSACTWLLATVEAQSLSWRSSGNGGCLVEGSVAGSEADAPFVGKVGGGDNAAAVREEAVGKEEESARETPPWLVQMLLICPVAETRSAFAEILMHALKVVATDDKRRHLDRGDLTVTSYVDPKRTPALSIRMIDSVVCLLPEAATYWRQFSEFFLLLLEISSISFVERVFFIQNRLVSLLIDFYLWEGSPWISDSVGRDSLLLGKDSMSDCHCHYLAWTLAGKREKLGDKFASPNYTPLVELISSLVTSSDVTSPLETTMVPPADAPSGTLSLPACDAELLYLPDLFSKLLHLSGGTVAPTAKLSAHVCRDNFEFSQKLISIISSGVNDAEYNEFQPYLETLLELLDIDDSHHLMRCTAACDGLITALEDNNAFPNYTTYLVRFLHRLSLEQPRCRSLIFEHRNTWLGTILLSQHEAVREVACTLVRSLVPEFMDVGPSPLAAAPPRLEPLTPVDGAGLTFDGGNGGEEGAEERLRALLESTGKLLPLAIENVDGHVREPGTAFLSLLKILQWTVRTPLDQLFFTPFMENLLELFWRLDLCKLEVDQNKKEASVLLYQVMNGCLENIDVVANHRTQPGRMFIVFLSLPNSEDTRFIAYNREALPPFYNIYWLCARHSQSFLREMMYHENFDWAINNVYFAQFSYDPAPEIVYRLVLLCLESGEERFRHVWIQHVLQRPVLSLPYAVSRGLTFLRDLIRTPEDAALFCRYNGLEAISALLEDHRKLSVTDPSWSVDLPRALHILAAAAQWMASDPRDELSNRRIAEALRRWDGRFSTFSLLLQYFGDSVPAALHVEIHALLRFLAGKDPACLGQALEWLLTKHVRYHQEESEKWKRLSRNGESSGDVEMSEFFQQTENVKEEENGPPLKRARGDECRSAHSPREDTDGGLAVSKETVWDLEGLARHLNMRAPYPPLRLPVELLGMDGAAQRRNGALFYERYYGFMLFCVHATTPSLGASSFERALRVANMFLLETQQLPDLQHVALQVLRDHWNSSKGRAILVTDCLGAEFCVRLLCCDRMFLARFDFAGPFLQQVFAVLFTGAKAPFRFPEPLLTSIGVEIVSRINDSLFLATKEGMTGLMKAVQDITANLRAMRILLQLESFRDPFLIANCEFLETLSHRVRQAKEANALLLHVSRFDALEVETQVLRSDLLRYQMI